MEDEVSLGWSWLLSHSLQVAGFLTASLPMQQSLKKAAGKGGWRRARLCGWEAPCSTGSEPEWTGSSHLIWCSLESRQIGCSNQYDGNVVGGLYQQKRNPPLYGWTFISLFPPSPVLIPVRGRIFSPSSHEMKECPPFDTSWVGWTLQNDLHKILIPKHQSLFLTGKNPKNSWKNCQRAVGLILSTAFG